MKGKAMVCITDITVSEAIGMLGQSLQPLFDFIESAVEEKLVDSDNVIVPMMALEWMMEHKQAAAQALAMASAVVQVLRNKLKEAEGKGGAA